MASTFLFDTTEYSIDDITQVIAEQLAEEQYTYCDNLRVAVMYSPKVMTSKEFVEAASRHNVNPSTARRCYSYIRKQQIEDGEI